MQRKGRSDSNQSSHRTRNDAKTKRNDNLADGEANLHGPGTSTSFAT